LGRAGVTRGGTVPNSKRVSGITGERSFENGLQDYKKTRGESPKETGLGNQPKFQGELHVKKRAEKS